MADHSRRQHRVVLEVTTTVHEAICFVILRWDGLAAVVGEVDTETMEITAEVVAVVGMEEWAGTENLVWMDEVVD